MKRLRTRKQKILFLILLAVLIVGLVWLLRPDHHQTPTKVSIKKSSSQKTKPAVFNKSQHSVNDPSSIWVVVNKGRALPATYAPASFGALGIRTDASQALTNLFSAAQIAGVPMKLTSGYRSYNNQQSVYNNYVKSYGQTKADTFSARPGHSEHQTGLAADLEPISGHCELDPCFGDTPEGKWLAANAYKFGFIVRYQKAQENLTGYEYEPWHVRYVGKSLATEIFKTGQTLEQFFGLPIYTDYPTDMYQLKIGN